MHLPLVLGIMSQGFQLTVCHALVLECWNWLGMIANMVLMLVVADPWMVAWCLCPCPLLEDFLLIYLQPGFCAGDLGCFCFNVLQWWHISSVI